MPKVVVDVMPKPEILDPQGKAVLGALPRLGFDGEVDGIAHLLLTPDALWVIGGAGPEPAFDLLRFALADLAPGTPVGADAPPPPAGATTTTADAPPPPTDEAPTAAGGTPPPPPTTEEGRP